MEKVKKGVRLEHLSKIYQVADQRSKDELEPCMEDIRKKYEKALTTFEDEGLSADERKRMTIFSFISLLSYDVYVKKLLIEKILDNMTEADGKMDSSKDKKKK